MLDFKELILAKNHADNYLYQSPSWPHGVISLWSDIRDDYISVRIEMKIHNRLPFSKFKTIMSGYETNLVRVERLYIYEGEEGRVVYQVGEIPTTPEATSSWVKEFICSYMFPNLIHLEIGGVYDPDSRNILFRSRGTKPYYVHGANVYPCVGSCGLTIRHLEKLRHSKLKTIYIGDYLGCVIFASKYEIRDSETEVKPEYVLTESEQYNIMGLFRDKGIDLYIGLLDRKN